MRIARAIALIGILALVSADILAQEFRGTLEGRVVDTSGAMLPGVAVAVTNSATGVGAVTV